MEQRYIGSVAVSLVGLGCNNFGWRIDADASAAVVQAALESGIRFFDTADVYGNTESELFLGRALKGRRDQVVIATKFGHPVADQRGGAHPDYVREAAEASLRRLDTDHIDLYQLHRPDPGVPIADTLGALDDLVRAGKVRRIGCSNFSAEQLREAQQALRPGAARFVSLQNQYSLLHREPELEVLPECRREEIAFIPYYPLASGLLTGKYRKGQPPPEGSRLETSGRYGDLLSEENLDIVEALVEFAREREHTLLELAFSWLAAQYPVASIIAGATKPEQVRANARSIEWKLTSEDLAQIDSIAPPP
jgi:aryl-alcohol dehydrogenase-like predicted oxidoreductase